MYLKLQTEALDNIRSIKGLYEDDMQEIIYIEKTFLRDKFFLESHGIDED